MTRLYDAAMRLGLTLVVCLITVPEAHAGNDLRSFLVGPVVGIRVGGSGNGSRTILGFEGGYGYGPERINLGFEHRFDGKDLGYIELDPWYLIGGTLGVGIDSDGDPQVIAGLWEGFPLTLPNCGAGGWHRAITISGGYRYTGVHELYLTLKAGVSEEFCLFGD